MKKGKLLTVLAGLVGLFLAFAQPVLAANPSDIAVYPDPFQTYGPKSNYDYSANWTPHCSPGPTNRVDWYTGDGTLRSVQQGFDCLAGMVSDTNSNLIPGSVSLWGYGANLLPASLPHSPLFQFQAPDNSSYYLTVTSNLSGYTATSSVPTCTGNCTGAPTSTIIILPDPAGSGYYSPYGLTDLTSGWQPYCTPGPTNTIRWYLGDGTGQSQENSYDCATGDANTTGNVPGTINVWNYGSNIIPSTLPHNTGNFRGYDGDFYFTLTNGNGAVYRYDYGWHTKQTVTRFDWIWNGTDYVFPSDKLTPVIIIPGIVGSAQYNDIWVIDPITHGFDNLIDTLVANGYTKDDGINLHPDLFTFPYDWHKSNVDTAVLLKQKIDQVKQICGCDKVDLVAHSMGGLVARQYIESSYYDHDVRNMIFIGTPHLGSPVAYLMWEGGVMDTDINSEINHAYLTAEAVEHLYTNLFDYIRATPITSVQELLPVYNYITHLGSTDVPVYPNTNWYPSNSFLENLNANIANLYNSGVVISNFVGAKSGNKTITAIIVVPPTTISETAVWGFGFPNEYPNKNAAGLVRDVGDELVPINSASFVNQNIHIFDANHGDLITAAEGDIFKQLTGKDATTLIQTKYNNLSLITSLIMFHIHSPADIMVIAPDGKREGKDFSTGQEYHEINGAFYSGYQTDNEYITIPNPVSGQYKLITEGTGSGKYTLVTDTITDATSSESSFVGQTTPGLVSTHNVNVDMANPSETFIAPEDQIPPTITFAQPATTTYTHADFLPVNVTFTDTTGVAISSVAFDAPPIAASSTVDLFYETLGAHNISATSTDLVNNSTSSVKVIQVIATASSTISDVQREYSLGWIKSKTVRDLLITKLTTAVKLQKITDTIVVSTKPLVTKKVDRWVQILDTILLKSILVDLTLAKATGQINSQGNQFLVADINWLLTH